MAMDGDRVCQLYDYLKEHNYTAREILVAIEYYREYEMASTVDRYLLLGQNTFWRDEGDNVIQISEMEVTHARNLLGWLERQFASYQNAELEFAYTHEAPDDVINGIMQSTVEATPLYKAVQARANEDGANVLSFNPTEGGGE